MDAQIFLHAYKIYINLSVEDLGHSTLWRANFIMPALFLSLVSGISALHFLVILVNHLASYTLIQSSL